uniref:Uncharacterized protein n=1 Tax=Palpitomonas bilix TaxID=652834 RepID=A0A7S3DHF0_9EUKA|mmetsp:Transcript_38016/g.98146  ORF Transcript_38016/g.98146 Transcript_38016/m.98146 type:complete len:244 (+) Transcript_38016:196-927(+)
MGKSAPKDEKERKVGVSEKPISKALPKKVEKGRVQVKDVIALIDEARQKVEKLTGSEPEFNEEWENLEKTYNLFNAEFERIEKVRDDHELLQDLQELLPSNVKKDAHTFKILNHSDVEEDGIDRLGPLVRDSTLEDEGWEYLAEELSSDPIDEFYCEGGSLETLEFTFRGLEYSVAGVDLGIQGHNMAISVGGVLAYVCDDDCYERLNKACGIDNSREVIQALLQAVQNSGIGSALVNLMTGC